MNNKSNTVESIQARWARFRFSVIGHLLASPPDCGFLKNELELLAKKTWRHPITGLPAAFAKSTIERWLYQARNDNDPVGSLRTKRRADAGKSIALSPELKSLIQKQYRAHKSWSYQLHFDNIKSVMKAEPHLGTVPSYNSVRRYMKANGLHKQQRVRKKHTDGAIAAEKRLESREVRSYEVDYVNSLWHLDFHHGSRKILGKDGIWHKAFMLAILDDRSRLICHAQWYLDETAETLVHGFMQALQKRGLPRALMTDNGSAMISSEFTEGLARLGILHQPTLPYSPYQNAKQEVFWSQVEGRLMAMLEGETEITLSLLNKATIAWIEQEYHHKLHSELATTPLKRYLDDPNVGRPCPDSNRLRQLFCRQTGRKQRRSDGTISLDGKRFEIPSQYRTLENVCIRYAEWDLSTVQLIDKHNDTILSTLYPQDKSANANAMRRKLNHIDNEQTPDNSSESSGIAPLLKELMADISATGLPSAYIPRSEDK